MMRSSCALMLLAVRRADGGVPLTAEQDAALDAMLAEPWVTYHIGRRLVHWLGEPEPIEPDRAVHLHPHLKYGSCSCAIRRSA